MKRGRNQRRRQGPNPNRALDSNGPDVRIRGTANQIHEKYLNLARDASSSGDRVKAENYFQHAEHYFRLIKSQQPPQQQQQQQSDQADSDGEQPSAGNDRNEKRGRNRPSNEARSNGKADQAGDAGPREASTANGAAGESGGDEEKKPRRRRARRPAKTNEGDADAGSDTTADTANETAEA